MEALVKMVPFCHCWRRKESRIQVQTWLELNDKLMPNGRIMVNCGGSIDDAASAAVSGSVQLKYDEILQKNSTINALCKAFPGKGRMKLCGIPPTHNRYRGSSFCFAGLCF